VKKEEDAAKEALDGTALAEFFFGPVGGKQERFLWRLGFQGMTATA
jgi:hypothetical protein